MSTPDTKAHASYYRAQQMQSAYLTQICTLDTNMHTIYKFAHQIQMCTPHANSKW